MKVTCEWGSSVRGDSVRDACVPPQDAAPFKAELSYRGSEPEPEYSIEAAGVPEAGSQQGLAYTSEPVYETTEAPGHYQAGTGPHSSHAQGREGS